MATPGDEVEASNDLTDGEADKHPSGTTSSVEGHQVEESVAKEDFNILILGETGVGKSTWINGIANYAKHDSLQDAMNDPDFTVLIPSRFIFTNENGEEMDIAFGSADDNEVLSSGQSATQFPQEYRLETSTTIFHLIDTPGIGDCRGIDKDKENFDNILGFLSCYNKINAVVVLLKPNNSRLTVAFKFCVLELLTHLHKSLVSNIMFAFTNSRGTFYRPGDSLPVLKKLLDENSIGIDVSPSNYFCFDNEAFRLLACHKRGIKFTAEDVDLYAQSWVKSCDTTCRLFERVKSMTPHDTKKTLSLNEARNCIIALSKPMGQAVELIEMNLKKIKDMKDQCQTFEKDIKAFQKEIKFKGFDLEIEPLDYPMTVCAASACKRYVPIGKSGQQNTVYEQVCHNHCNLSGVPIETTNNDQLHRCWAMTDGVCRVCGHNCREHMHIRYTANVVVREFLSEEALSKIKQRTDLNSQRQLFVRELETNIQELEAEKHFIYQCASYFGVFLKQNAMIAYNDSFGEYLDMLIREEEMKEKVIRDEAKIAQMKKDKKTYEEKKNVIIENIKKVPTEGNKVEVMPIEKIYEMREKLCSLKHNGKTLREALDGIISARQKIHKTKVASKSCVYAKTNNSWLPGIFNRINPFRWRNRSRSNLSISQY